MELYPDQDWWESHSVEWPRRKCSEIVNGFRDLVDKNPPEREIQSYITKFPWILAEQFPHCHFIFPQFRLGSNYVADFVAPEKCSGGAVYYFVEIEQAGHSLMTKSGKFTAPVRNAVEQVQEWRRWIIENYEYVKRDRSKNGLGLHDLTRYIVGKVYIGRRSNQNDRFNELRQTLLEQSSIDICSYDRMIEWAAYRANFWDGYDAQFADGRFIPRYDEQV